jgi:hypothetical protein
MRRFSLYGLALAGLVLLTGAVRSADEAESSFKPAILVRVKPIDELIADARYLVKQAGREEEAKQFEQMLKAAKKGSKGLKGIDTKKPIGLYGSPAAQLPRSQAVLLVPIADEKTFLDFLENVDLKPEKDDTGLYTLTLPVSPFPVQFRFANGYLYGTAKFSEKGSLPANDKLPLPATVLAGGGGLLSVTVNIDRIPMQLRELGITGSSTELDKLKDQAPLGESEAHKKFREAVLEEAAVQFKSVLTDGGAVMFKLDVDREKNDLSLSFSFGAKEGSSLAKNIAHLGTAKSVAAGIIGSSAAIDGLLHLSLPENIRKALGPLVDEGFKKALDQQDAGARELLTPLADALKATAKHGALDFGVSVRGPAKNGKFTFVAGARVQHGDAIEKAIKDVVNKLPEEVKKPIKLDVAEADGVQIHRITPDPDHVKSEVKAMFGEGPVYVAIRKDALIVTLGENALDAIKEAIASKAKAAKIAHVEVSLRQVAKQMTAEHPTAPEAAKKAFKEEGSDKVRLSVTGGNQIEVKLNVKGAIIAFAALLDKAKKEEK